MSHRGDDVPRFIWATRGRSWGFRFLRTGGIADPLPVYERAFGDVSSDREVWRRGRKRAALRFPDPEGRRDESGRVIPHDFVLLGAWADTLTSMQDGRDRVWREVADEFGRVWAEDTPPPPRP